RARRDPVPENARKRAVLIRARRGCGSTSRSARTRACSAGCSSGRRARRPESRSLRRPPQRCLRTRVALSRTEESRSEEHDKPNRRQRSDCDDEHHHSIDHFTSHSSPQSSELWRLAGIISEPCRQFVHSLAACSDRERAWSPEHGIPVFHDLEMIFHAEQENGYRGGG